MRGTLTLSDYGCLFCSYLQCSLCSRDNDVRVENEVHLSFTFDMVNAFRSFPVGQHIRRLSGYRKLSLGVTIMVFIGLFCILMVSGWSRILSAEAVQVLGLYLRPPVPPHPPLNRWVTVTCVFGVVYSSACRHLRSWRFSSVLWPETSLSAS